MSSSDPKPGAIPAAAPDLELLGDQLILHPSGVSGDGAQHGVDTERNLVEHMSRFRESPFDFLKEVSLHVSGTGWRAYDNPIGQPIFYAGFSEKIKNAVAATPMLQKKIQELAEKRVAQEEKEGTLNSESAANKRERRIKIEESLREVADKMTDEMICKMESKIFIRGAYYSATQLLTRAYHQGTFPERICT